MTVQVRRCPPFGDLSPSKEISLGEHSQREHSSRTFSTNATSGQRQWCTSMSWEDDTWFGTTIYVLEILTRSQHTDKSLDQHALQEWLRKPKEPEYNREKTTINFEEGWGQNKELLTRIKSPFSLEIMAIDILKVFRKSIKIEPYIRVYDPTEHLDAFLMAMSFLGATNALIWELSL